MINELGITKKELETLCETNTQKNIGDKLGIQEQKIGWWIRKLGIKTFRQTRKDVDAICQKCSKSYKTKRFYYEKLKHHFCSQKCCTEWRKLYGPKGEDNPKYGRQVLIPHTSSGQIRQIENAVSQKNGIQIT